MVGAGGKRWWLAKLPLNFDPCGNAFLNRCHGGGIEFLGWGETTPKEGREKKEGDKTDHAGNSSQTAPSSKLKPNRMGFLHLDGWARTLKIGQKDYGWRTGFKN
jgi:hypothetical protein